MPLSHPDSRFVTVLSGTFFVAFGNTFDATKLKALPAGGIYTEPTGANTLGKLMTNRRLLQSQAKVPVEPPTSIPPMPQPQASRPKMTQINGPDKPDNEERSGHGAAAAMPIFLSTPQELSVTSSAAGTVGISQVGGQSATVLYGDPLRAGLDTVLIHVESNRPIMPLSHPHSRFVSVLPGTFFVAFGDAHDETKLKAFPPGDIYTEPAGANHFGETRNERVLIAITGYGPSGTTYVNPAASGTTQVDLT